MTETIQNLYSALSAHGLQKKDIRAFLPSWWDDEIATTPAGLQQAKLILAKALNLKVRPLVEVPPRVEFDLPAMRRFKLHGKTTEDDVELAVSLARSASKLVLSAIDRPYTKPGAAAEVREKILGAGKQWVDLESLIEYCWEAGIPVIHLASAMMRRKMDGIAMATKGRPTIVLSSQKPSGFLLFHLAHELGHIALGHLDPNGAIVDNEIKKDPENKDASERDADNYALELLAGNHRNLILRRYEPPAQLARTVIDFGRRNGIAPTHVLLNCAYNGNFWGLCVNTLKILADGGNDKETISSHLFANIPEDTKEDSLALLRTLVG
ncbi:ImmA/IrrE family metallo-endopeptidase [Pseudomonas sp. FP215]|uniref:ImmA/IrrE family metallo-endopeptidase n=1 Tax=Pseudomonas sp. FP215 TaxID=2738126 RepID=UPI0027334093|nr:ImmA/IrrE family metallo-endopeptidase [Pseudomonas sp. FP215]WLH22248.1 ImmA/IrrE family metallo-endopeptidase [Pseudomonas sp. FP215]